MRQTGLLSASAAYALTYNFPLLPRVHELTRRLENGLEGLGVRITSSAETCMVRLFLFLLLLFCRRFSCFLGLLRSHALGHQLPGARHTC